MGLFGKKDKIANAALGTGGAFDKNKKTDKAAVFGAAVGSSIGSGQDWTLEDSLKLSASIDALDASKNIAADSYSYSSTDSDSGTYHSLLLSSDQEEELEAAGIDIFELEFMSDDERDETLEDAGLDPFDYQSWSL